MPYSIKRPFVASIDPWGHETFMRNVHLHSVDIVKIKYLINEYKSHLRPSVNFMVKNLSYYML